MSLPSYRPGSSITPARLNDVQDDYDKTAFVSWKDWGWHEAIIDESFQFCNLYFCPTMYGMGLESNLSADTVRGTEVRYIDPAVDWNAGVAAANRSRHVRMVVEICTDQQTPPIFRYPEIGFVQITGYFGSTAEGDQPLAIVPPVLQSNQRWVGTTVGLMSANAGAYAFVVRLGDTFGGSMNHNVAFRLQHAEYAIS